MFLFLIFITILTNIYVDYNYNWRSKGQQGREVREEPSPYDDCDRARDATSLSHLEPLVCIFIIRNVFSILINVNSCKFPKSVGH